MDPIRYRIDGDDLQLVEIELEAGHSAVAEPGAMMYMDHGLVMDTVLGDGSGRGNVLMRFWRGLKRSFTGESLFSSVFTNPEGGARRVAFAAPYPGKIVPIDLPSVGGMLICQKGAFLCAARGVEVGIALQKRLRVGFFGGEGFIMQKLQGQGVAFIHASGMLSEIRLQPGETLRVDTGCLAALQPSVRYDIQYAGRVKTALFGGEGLFFASLQGPGTVWLQSLPIKRLASRIVVDGLRQRSSGWGARIYLVFVILFLLLMLAGPSPPS